MKQTRQISVLIVSIVSIVSLMWFSIAPSYADSVAGGQIYYANVETALNIRPSAHTMCPPLAEVNGETPLELIRYSSKDPQDPDRWAQVAFILEDTNGKKVRHEGWVKASFLISEDARTEAATTCGGEGCTNRLNPAKLSRLFPPEECDTSGLVDPFLNPKGCWSQKVNEAKACAPAAWRKLSAVERAEHMRKSFRALIEAHGWKDRPYTPEHLTCIAYHESTLNPQMQNTGGSNAFGLGQVMKGTANEIFATNAKYNWFESSKVQGFKKVTSGTEFLDKMRTSLLAQMELSLLALELKRREAGNKESSSVIIGNYRGAGKAENQRYAAHIRDCAKCINNGAGRVTEGCLKKAKY